MKHKIYIRNSRKGLCLIEVLLSLSIMALLLGATAVAFDAALGNYKVNHDLASVSVSARNALYQMCTEIRSAYNAYTDPDLDPIVYYITISNGGTVCTIDSDAYNRSVEYYYDADMHQLKVRVTKKDEITGEYKTWKEGGIWSDWYVMVNDVHPITVGEEIFTLPPPQPPVPTPPKKPFPDGTVGKVEIRFMVSREGLSRTFSQAVVPRNVLYGL